MAKSWSSSSSDSDNGGGGGQVSVEVCRRVGLRLLRSVRRSADAAVTRGPPGEIDHFYSTLLGENLDDGGGTSAAVEVGLRFSISQHHAQDESRRSTSSTSAPAGRSFETCPCALDLLLVVKSRRQEETEEVVSCNATSCKNRQDRDEDEEPHEVLDQPLGKKDAGGPSRATTSSSDFCPKGIATGEEKAFLRAVTDDMETDAYLHGCDVEARFLLRGGDDYNDVDAPETRTRARPVGVGASSPCSTSPRDDHVADKMNVHSTSTNTQKGGGAVGGGGPPAPGPVVLHEDPVVAALRVRITAPSFLQLSNLLSALSTTSPPCFSEVTDEDGAGEEVILDGVRVLDVVEEEGSCAAPGYCSGAGGADSRSCILDNHADVARQTFLVEKKDGQQEQEHDDDDEEVDNSSLQRKSRNNNPAGPKSVVFLRKESPTVVWFSAAWSSGAGKVGTTGSTSATRTGAGSSWSTTSSTMTMKTGAGRHGAAGAQQQIFTLSPTSSVLDQSSSFVFDVWSSMMRQGGMGGAVGAASGAAAGCKGLLVLGGTATVMGPAIFVGSVGLLVGATCGWVGGAARSTCACSPQAVDDAAGGGGT